MDESTNRPEDGIVVDGKKNQQGGKSFRLGGKGVRVAAVVLLVGLLATGGYYWQHHKTAPTVVTKPKTPSQRAQTAVSDYLAQKSGNSTEALNDAENTLQASEQKASTPGDKQVYASALIQVYNYAGDKSAALQKAQQMDQQYKTAFTAAQLAGEYQMLGDKANAIKYYKLASSRSPKTAPTERSAYNDYRLAAEQLESQ